MAATKTNNKSKSPGTKATCTNQVGREGGAHG